MTPSSTAAIQTVELVKQFGSQAAVGGISLDVPRGSVFGFLGPNGSGKTTTIRMLLGLAEPTKGEVLVLGKAVPKQLDAALPDVGALVEGPAFYPYLSGRKTCFAMTQPIATQTRAIVLSEWTQRSSELASPMPLTKRFTPTLSV